jgi:hypothetical protein
MMKIFFFVLVLAGLLVTGAPGADTKPDPLSGAFDPEQVLLNLEATVKARDWKRYADFLAPGFRFVPFAAIPTDYPGVDWEQWDRKQEIVFIRELVGPDRGAVLDLSGRILDKGRESHGKAEWDLVYTIESMGQVFTSRAVFVFQKIDNLWYLAAWTDTTIESEEDTARPLPTSGSLRGALSW